MVFQGGNSAARGIVMLDDIQFSKKHVQIYQFMVNFYTLLHIIQISKLRFNVPGQSQFSFACNELNIPAMTITYVIFYVIPAPHQVRDKLQPVEDSDLSENPEGFSLYSHKER